MLIIFELITVGLPFAIFKMMTGIFKNWDLLTLLGSVDLILNFTNLIIFPIKKKKILPTCTLAFLAQTALRSFPLEKNQKEDTGNALDMFFSFALVAWIIGSGALKNFSIFHLQLWNISVILNVLGAGIQRLHLTYSRISHSILK